MFTGSVGRIRLDVDVATGGAVAKVAALAKAIQNIEVDGRGKIGDLFARETKSFKQFAKESDNVYNSVNALISKSYFLQSAISGLVPVVAQLVGGLFALGSQAAAAAPALIVLPGIMTAMMQAAITAKLALGGVFKAVGELGKAKTTAVDQMPKKLRAFENAQYRVKKAQEALTRAYREADERIEQLGFDTEDAALAQQRAALALEDARATLARVQDLPPNSRARQEAELAFKEADLNYRRAIDTSEDLVEEQNRVSKNGELTGREQVNQSEEVLDAQRNLRESMLDLLEAQKELNKAQSGGGGLTEFNKLSKEAQAFAKYLVSLKPQLQELKDAAGKELFGPLTEATQNLVDNFLPKLKPLLEETGKALGNTALDFSKIATEANNLANFETVGKTNIDTIGKLGKVVGNLYSAFLSLLAAADPLIRRFTDWVVVLTGGWKATSEADNQSGKLAKTFEYAGDVASQLGDILGNLFGALMNMGKAAAGPGSGGEMILDALEKWSEKWKNLTKMMLEDGSLSDYFRKSSEGFMKVAGIIGKIVKIILKSATQEGTGEFLDSISRAVDTLGVGFNKLAGSAPSLGKFIEGFARLIVAFTESGSIRAFFTLLTKAVNIAAAVFENEFVAKLFGALAVMHGTKLAIIAIKKVLIMLAQYMLGMIRAMLRPFLFMFDALTKVLGLTSIQAVAIIGAIAALVAVLVLAWKNSKKFRDALKDLADKVLGALSKAFEDIGAKFGEVFGGIFGTGVDLKSLFKGIGDALAKYVVPIFAYLLPKAVEVASVVIQGIIVIIGGLVKVVVGVFKMIGAIFKLFTGDFDGFLSGMGAGIKDVFGGLFDTVVGFFSGLFAPITVAFAPVFDFIGGKVSAVVGVFQPLFDVIAKIAGIVRTVLYVGFLIAFTTIGIVIAETWRLIKRIGTALLDNLAFPMIRFVLPIFKFSFAAIKKIFEVTFRVLTIVAGVAFIGLQIGVKLFWALSKKVFGLFAAVFRKTFDIIGSVFSAVWPAIWGGIQFAWNNVIKPVFGFILAYYKFVFKGMLAIFNAIWPAIWGGIQFAWNSVIKPVFGFIIAYWKFVFNGIKTVFEAIWPLIWGGIKFAWNSVIKPIFGFIGSVFSAVWDGVKSAFDAVWPLIWGGIQFAWNNVIKPTFELIGSVFAFMWRGVEAIFNAVWPVIWGGIQFAWNNVIKPVFNALGSAFSFIFNNIILPVFNAVWPLIWGGIKFAWNNVIKPVFDALGSAFSFVWNSIIKPAFDLVWGAISGSISFVWENVIKPIFTNIGSVFSTAWDGIKTAFSRVWDGIKLAFTDFPQFIKNIFNRVIGVFNSLLRGITNAFSQIPTLLGKVWGGVVSIFKGGVNFIIKAFNKVLGGKKFTLPGILGGGTFGFDKIPEIGSGDKFDFEQIVTGGYRDIPGLALGGTVYPRNGGTLARIAEAGRPERIEPLDPDGLSNRDKAMIKLLSGGAGGVTINVHPSPGMNEVELAALVNRQLAFQLRKGAA